MEIGGKWRIESDNLNVTLYQKKRRKSKTGQMYDAWETLGYFATVENALHELVNQGIRDTKLQDLETIIPLITELHEMIEKRK